MVRLQATPQAIELSFSSDVTFVSHALEILRTLLRYQGLRDPTNLLLAARELLKNAVVHGNRNRPDTQVHVDVSGLGTGQYRLVVQDQGEGFELERVGPGPTGRGVGDAARGFDILRAVASELTTNERGNRITVTIDAPVQTGGPANRAGRSME